MANPTAHGEGHHHYIAPVSQLVKILAWLVGLTVLTVVTGTANLGPLNFIHVPLALGIAAVKVTLVVLIFMGLKHDNRVNSLVFILSGIFVTVFLTFTLFDTVFRGDLTNVDPMTISNRRLVAAEDSTALTRYQNLRVAPGDYLLGDSTAAEKVASPDTAAAPGQGGDAPGDTAPAQQ